MKKSIKLLIIFICLFCFVTNVKAIELEKKNIKFEDSEAIFNSIEATNDGGYIMVGSLGNDGVITKVNKNNEMEWEKTYGSEGYEYIFSVIVTEDGYLVVGDMNSDSTIEGLSYNGGWSDALIVKYDKDGNVVWQKNYGGNSEDHFYDVTLTSDGGFIASGETASTDFIKPYTSGYNAFIIKCDRNGNIEWKQTYGNGNMRSVFEISDNQYLGLHKINTHGISKSSIFIIDKEHDNIRTLELKRNITSIEKNENEGYVITYINDTGELVFANLNNQFEIISEKILENSVGVESAYINKVNNGYGIIWSTRCEDPEDPKNPYKIKISNNFSKLDKNGNFIFEENFSSKDINTIYKVAQINNKEIIIVASKMIDGQNTNFIYKIKEIKYEFEDEKEQKYDPTSDDSLTFKCDVNINLLNKVYVNDQVLDTKYYTLKEGSTIITLNKEYLSSLSDGSYILKLELVNEKIVSTKFTVETKPQKNNETILENNNSNIEEVPKTGDNVILYICMFTISVIGILYLYLLIRKNNKKINC